MHMQSVSEISVFMYFDYREYIHAVLEALQSEGASMRSIQEAAALSFIGLGIMPPNPEWGAMLSASRNYIRDYPWMVIFPGLAIMLTVFGLNLFGDGLRDAMDPKLKK